MALFNKTRCFECHQVNGVTQKCSNCSHYFHQKCYKTENYHRRQVEAWKFRKNNNKPVNSSTKKKFNEDLATPTQEGGCGSSNEKVQLCYACQLADIGRNRKEPKIGREETNYLLSLVIERILSPESVIYHILLIIQKKICRQNFEILEEFLIEFLETISRTAEEFKGEFWNRFLKYDLLFLFI